MPKLTAPLLWMGAKGQIGKTMVMSTWKGVPYARQYVTPANPRTTKQVANRGIWAFLNAAYLYAPTQVKAAFDAFAVGKPLTGRNKFFQDNQKLLAVQPTPTQITNFIFSPGALGGLPPASVTPTPGAGTLSLAITAPTVLPTDWTIQAAVGACIRDQDPDTGVLFNINAGEDLTAAYVVAFAGLAAADWAWGAWLRWVRPDGLIAYSPALTGISTVT